DPGGRAARRAPPPRPARGRDARHLEGVVGAEQWPDHGRLSPLPRGLLPHPGPEGAGRCARLSAGQGPGPAHRSNRAPPGRLLCIKEGVAMTSVPVDAATSPTPIPISPRTRTIISLALVVVALLLLRAMPSVVGIFLGGTIVALLFSFPVRLLT